MGTNQELTNAERLVAATQAMPIETVRARIEMARSLTNDELVALWEQERRTRAEQTADRLKGAGDVQG